MIHSVPLVVLVALAAGELPETVEGPFWPVEIVRIEGRVVDEFGQPIPSAEVILGPRDATRERLGLPPAHIHVALVRQGERLPSLERVACNSEGRFVLQALVDAGIVRAAPYPERYEERLRDPWFVAVAPGYGARVVSVRSRGPVLDVGDVMLTPGGRVLGRLMDEQGLAVAQARVWVHRYVDAAPEMWGALAGDRLRDTIAVETDEAGRFNLGPLWPGEITLVWAPQVHLGGGRKCVQIHPGEDTDLGDIPPEIGAVLRGEVVGAEGRPLESARVVIGPEFNPWTLVFDPVLAGDPVPPLRRLAAALRPYATDATGAFAVPGLTPDATWSTCSGASTWLLLADAPGYEPTVQSGLLVSDWPTIVLEPESVAALTVVDGVTGRSIDAARVRATRVEYAYGSEDLATCREYDGPALQAPLAPEPGRFVVPGLGARATEVVVTAPGYGRQSIPIEGVPPGTFVQRAVTLSPESTVRGTLVDSDGKPSGGALVTATLVRESRQGRPLDIHVVHTFADERGRYLLTGLGPGRWRLAVGSPGQEITREVTLGTGDHVALDLLSY